MTITDRLEKDAVERLRRVEGQIRGIMKMIQERRYCIDVVLQVAAAEAALHKVGELILRNHIETCVMEAFRSGRKKEVQEKVDELMAVYAKFRPR